MEVREQLPLHNVPEAARVLAGRRSLVIEGLVEQPRAVTTRDLANLTRGELVGPFRCEEGWQVPGLTWRGPCLADVLAIARPTIDALWVRVCSGEYAVPVPLAGSEAVILADELNGEALTLEHGAPWRLIVPAGACFSSVKWVERLELAATPGPTSGEELARARLRAND